jgi:hypothetical protein
MNNENKTITTEIKNDILFETTNPQGEQTILKKSIWENHILNRHPEMEDKLNYIQKSIEKPDYLLPNEKKEERKNYFLQYDKKYSVKTILEKTDYKTNIVITAHIIHTNKINKK